MKISDMLYERSCVSKDCFQQALYTARENIKEERDTYWKERVRKEVEGIKEKYSRRELQQGGYSQACDDILQVLDNLK